MIELEMIGYYAGVKRVTDNGAALGKHDRRVDEHVRAMGSKSA